MKSLLTFFLQTKAGASIPDGAMAARVPSKHKAVGSSPTSGTQDFFLVVGLGERFFQELPYIRKFTADSTD